MSGGSFRLFWDPPETGKTAVFPGFGPSPRDFPVFRVRTPVSGSGTTFLGSGPLFWGPDHFFGVRTTFSGSGREVRDPRKLVVRLVREISGSPYPDLLYPSPPADPMLLTLRITAVFPLDY